MRKVRILDEPKEEKQLKPVEFTHYLNVHSGWKTPKSKPNQYKEVIYLGKCNLDGDMFLAKSDNGTIEIFKGHLNDGVYE